MPTILHRFSTAVFLVSKSKNILYFTDRKAMVKGLFGEEGIVAQWVKPPLEMLAFHVGVSQSSFESYPSDLAS